MANRNAGIVGLFPSAVELIAAVRAIKAAGVQSFDVFTPYPIHGMDDLQGLRRSPLPYIAFVAGLIGCVVAFAFQYWTSVVDWPLIVGGKPFNSWPAFVPVMFEVTILFAGVSTVLGLLFFCRLPNFQKRAVDPRVSSDQFALLIEGKKLDESGTVALLKKVGARDVRVVPVEGWF